MLTGEITLFGKGIALGASDKMKGIRKKKLWKEQVKENRKKERMRNVKRHNE